MRKNRTKISKTFITSIIIATMLTSGSMTAYAATTDKSGAVSPTAVRSGLAQSAGKATEVDYSAFVQKGLIDQETADALNAVRAIQQERREAEPGSITVITEEEAEAFIEQFESDGLPDAT